MGLKLRLDSERALTGQLEESREVKDKQNQGRVKKISRCDEERSSEKSNKDLAQHLVTSSGIHRLKKLKEKGLCVRIAAKKPLFF